MSRRRLTASLLAVLAVAGLSGASPAHAYGNVGVHMEYAGSGQIAFVCSAVAAYGPTTAKLGDATRVWCSVNGVRHTVSQSFGWHAHAVGTATVAPGSVATFCIEASAVYGLFPPLFAQVKYCKNAVVQNGGGVAF